MKYDLLREDLLYYKQYKEEENEVLEQNNQNIILLRNEYDMSKVNRVSNIIDREYNPVIKTIFTSVFIYLLCFEIFPTTGFSSMFMSIMSCVYILFFVYFIYKVIQEWRHYFKKKKLLKLEEEND